MSNQFPSNFNTNQVGGHRGNFNNPMMNQMNMAGVGQQQQQQQMAGMMGYNQSGMMQSPQHQAQMQNPGLANPMGGQGSGIVQAGGMGVAHVGPAGMPNQAHPNQPQVVNQQQIVQQGAQATNQPQLTLTTPTTPNAVNVPLMSNPAQGQVPNQPIVGQPPMHQQNQQKEFNIVSLCRFGQETVQDIVTRFQEVFQALRAIQLPNGINNSSTEKKVQEHFRTIRLLFKRLRILYDKCNDCCQQGMEYTHVESLIPLKDDPDPKPEPARSEEYKKALQENHELIDIANLRNKQLREIIDRTRIIIWEINTMLSMRKS